MSEENTEGRGLLAAAERVLEKEKADANKNPLDDFNIELDLPDMPEPDTFTANDFNFDLDLPDNPETDTSFNTPVFDNTELSDTSFNDTSFDDTTLTDTSFDNSTSDDDFFHINNDEPAASGPLNFSGLFDDEPGLDSSDNSEPSKKGEKSKKSVIICVICAVICLIAVALVLFILPTEYNLLKNGTIKAKTKTEKAVTTATKDTADKSETSAKPIEAPALESPEKETSEPVVEAVPAAKENEVIIIEKAEEVVPLPPPAKDELLQDILYKIKWGDTLWDISDTYYKNPWRYKYLARFNNIPDPDYIVSGTTITIPAE